MGQRGSPGAQSFMASGTQGRQSRRFSEEPVNQPAQPRPESTGGEFSSNAVEFDIGGLRLVIKKGDITEEDTDAIVSSTNSYLDLRRGAVANALRQKCGPQLERELRGREHDIQQTGIIMTRAYGLNCKYILYVNAAKFSRGWEEGIDLCLGTAEMNRIKSVAMPALGTGMGLSPSTSAQALFGTLVERYKHGKQPGMLEEVRVVLFDASMIPAFVNTLQQSGSSYNKASSGLFSRIKSALSGSSIMGVKQTVSNPVVQQAPQQVSLFIYAEKMDDVREVLRAIDEMVEDRFIRREIQDKVITSFNENDVQRLEQIGQKHRAELQIHIAMGLIICDGLHKQVFECMQEVSEYIRSVQHEQQEKKMASMLANMVSWCLLEVTTTGTEKIEYPPRENQIIETAFQGKERCAEIKDNAGRVYVIDFNSMMEYPKDDPISTVSVMRRDKLKDRSESPKGAHGHRKNEQSMDVYICSTKKSALTEAREKIHRHVQHVCTSHTETNPLIANFSPKQKDELFKLQKKHNVEIDLDQKKSAVTFKGVDINVAKAVSSLKDIILSATTDRHLAAGMPPVRWQYEASKDKFVDFEPELVLLIEAAFKRKEPEVKFSDKRGRGYKIVFKDLKEYPLDRHGHPVAVKRRDILEEKKQEIPLPTHWAPMKGEKVKRVELKPDSNEYKRVSEHFRGHTAIKKIERIQNPSLFQQFKVKKKELEQHNPKGTENEKRLFHGTPSESVDGIITNGFNRSYCGKHGTALGNGVYFASDSNVSMGYARGGHMFQARVLVGEYTPGTSGQRMPPPKPNSIRSYDSLSNAPQNATVFVIFHDSQAYPEYLISF